MANKNSVSIKTKDEIELLKNAGQILAEIVERLKSSFIIGNTTQDIDILAENLMREYKVVPAFKGYRGYPGCICASINEEVVHGIPKDRELLDGDILSIDVGLIYEDFYSDMALTVGVGNISPDYQKLLEVTQQALCRGIDHAREGNHLSDISHTIQSFVESNNFSVVREFVGHGIGKNLHEDPEIPNFGEPGKGPILQEGMVLAIEPMVNCGAWQTKILQDKWTVVTQDGKPSAHFEHSIVVTKDEPLILTKL